MTERFVSQAEAARHFGVDPSLITRKKKQGKLTLKGNLVDLKRSAGAFSQVPVAKRQIEEAADNTGETFNDAQRRKETALANLRELEHAQKSGDTVSVAAMESAWAIVGQTMRDALLSLPERLAPIVAALSDVRQCRDVIQKEFRIVIANLPDQIRGAVGAVLEKTGDDEDKKGESRMHLEQIPIDEARISLKAVARLPDRTAVSKDDFKTLMTEGLLRPTGQKAGGIEDSPLVADAIRRAAEAKQRPGDQDQPAGGELASNPLVANAIKRAELAKGNR